MADYVWDGGGWKVAADVVGAAVDRIAAERGVCEPEHLVDAARDPASPLHPMFVWNDAEAAEAYRVDQARRAIRSLRLVMSDDPPKTPAFVSLRVVTDGQDKRQGYVALQMARSQVQTRDAVIRAELGRVRGLLDRNQWIPEFAPLRAALAEVEDELEADRVALAAD